MRGTLVAIVTLAVACSRPAPPPAPSIAAPPDAGDARDAAETAPLAGFPEQLELRDGDEALGFVAVPLGAREPRPILVALHGGSERPERACAAWRSVADGYPFVVCPRGWGGNAARLGWRSAADTRARIARAVAAAKATFGTWIDPAGAIVLAGFSMGGTQVPLVARLEPRTYRRIVIADTAHDPRSALTFAHAWAEGGGERAMFLCTTSGCEPSMRAAARKVAGAHAPARLVVAPTQVHALSERAVQSMRREWAWLVDGAEGWKAYVPPDAPALPGRIEVFDPM